MTIRLLAQYGIYPANAIITLDAATEAGLIATGEASANLTGGVVYSAPVQKVGNKPALLTMDALGPTGLDPLNGSGNSVTAFPLLMNTALPVTGSGVDQSLYTTIIPGNSMGKNGMLRITAHITHPNNANAKSYRLKLGGQLLFQTATSGNLEVVYGWQIYNTNNTGAQLCPSVNFGYSTTTLAATAGTVDTTVDQVLQLVGNTTAGDVMTLKSFMVEILHRD